MKHNFFGNSVFMNMTMINFLRSVSFSAGHWKWVTLPTCRVSYLCRDLTLPNGLFNYFPVNNKIQKNKLPHYGYWPVDWLTEDQNAQAFKYHGDPIVMSTVLWCKYKVIRKGDRFEEMCLPAKADSIVLSVTLEWIIKQMIYLIIAVLNLNQPICITASDRTNYYKICTSFVKKYIYLFLHCRVVFHDSSKLWYNFPWFTLQ